MPFVLPPKAEVGYLDPEIAGEGVKVIHSDGEQVNWSPPPARPVMPDWSQIKSIQKYFNRSGKFPTWPAWLYHPTEEPRLVKNAHEAAALGVSYGQATQEEKFRYGVEFIWSYADDSKWRASPYKAPKFDPQRPGQGKTYIPTPPNPVIAQNELVAALIPAVVAAVMQTTKGNGKQADPKEWEEFVKFQAWQKSQAAVSAVNALSEKSETFDLTQKDVEWEEWEERARAKNIKVDRRWSLARLKEEVEKVP